MKYTIPTFFAFVCLALLATAKIDILYPSKDYWLVANSTATILWNSTDPSDPQRFSIFLINPNVPDLKQYALANNAITLNHNVSIAVPDLTKAGVQQGYSIIFTNIGNITDVYATSETFDVKASGSPPSTYAPPTPPSTSGGNSSSTGKPSGSEIVSARMYLSAFFAVAVVAAMMAI
ncbi:11375_t:CDS:2 [Paraglomus brasilianum]|uniref:11375_t:CDS:1 n=1 Tax=Paraglomus brasilianum TaxID=144538 RepID=A0A9N9BAB1_9GLOM|nr:11375_t:CDS:2 [Paraglomus brasilianum]